MPNSVQIALDGRQLTISSRTSFPALVLAFDAESGNGAYVNCQVVEGRTVVPAPLGGRSVSFEVVDAEGAVRGQLAV